MFSRSPIRFSVVALVLLSLAAGGALVAQERAAVGPGVEAECREATFWLKDGKGKICLEGTRREGHAGGPELPKGASIWVSGRERSADPEMTKLRDEDARMDKTAKSGCPCLPRDDRGRQAIKNEEAPATHHAMAFRLASKDPATEYLAAGKETRTDAGSVRGTEKCQGTDHRMAHQEPARRR